MSYDVTIMRTTDDNVRVQVNTKTDTAVFNMQPNEARRFAFGVIETANEIDHADLNHPANPLTAKGL